ncbi:Dedicator of cytokinesis protein 3 [Rhizoctonia solani]|uniref:Dedicator of cytokinesis protein 3 n=1 Tax=Rhizoctonia solani TaxID=456999 RepID=A0A0K6FKS9_9AGAM|nr:Dedicator of cytokinesis protein 3 [Rhizoctonia solani]
MGWEPLPMLLYGFAIHPLSASLPIAHDRVSSLGPPRIELDAIPEHAPRNPHLARLDVGDEIYAFEVWREGGGCTWYRGYIVCTSNTPAAPAPPDPSPAQSTILGIPPAQDTTTVIEDPQVTIGIFPATHVHIRDELPDAEGRLATLIAQTQPHPRSGFHMATLQEEPDSPAQVQEKSEAPRPTLKSGDETALGLVEPLVDEIASALREWHARLFTYLAKRDYRTFTSVREHIDALHLGRRQLLLGGMSSEEAGALRRECVMRLVRGNVAQGLDVLVRHPAGGGLVGVEIDFGQGKKADVANWVSTIRMYAMQCALAYIDAQAQSYKPSALGPVHDLFFPPTTPLLTGPNPRKVETSRPKFHHILLDVRAVVAAPCAPGECTELFFSLYSKAGASFVTEDFCVVLNRNGVREDDQGGSPISAGTSPCGLVGRNESNDGLSGTSKPDAPIRTLFTDLGSHDLSEGLVLVCRIVRRGGMKLAPDGEGIDSAKPGMGTIDETEMGMGTRTGLGIMSEQGHGGSFSSARSPRRGSEPMYKSVWEDSVTQLPPPAPATTTKARRKSKSETANEDLRRPFGCAVLELVDLGVVGRESVGPGREYTMPIFVPIDESRFSTLHQDILRGDERCMEKSPRADMVAVTLKTLYGDSSTLVQENSSLLHSIPLTSRLGFPDVVFPGDTRNDAFIKLWSGEFQHTGSSSSSSLTRARTRKSIGALVGGMGGLGPPSVEVSVQVRTRGGRTLDHILSPGSGQPPGSIFRSTVLYKSPTPSFGELVKVQLEDEADHLFFTFRNRRGPAFAFAYLPLFPDGRAFVSDGTHRLVLYRTEKIESVQPKEYFGAPASVPGPNTKIELAPALQKVLQPTRDALVVRSFLVSTKYTQNSTLLALLNWEQTQDKDELANVLAKFTFVGEVEIVKFLQDIFDALFAVLVSPLNGRGELDDLVFSALVTVLGIIQDRRFNNFEPVLDVYIDQHFSCAAAPGHMIHSMNRLLSSPSGEETASPLRAALKVWHYVFRFIVRARQLQQVHEVGMGITSEHLEGAFKREVLGHLNEVNKVMARTSADIIGTQTIALQHFASILPDLSTSFSTTELVPIVTGFANSLVSTKGKLVVWKLLMYIQLVRSFIFDDPKSRSLLVESIISWIKPHFGKFNEFTMTSAGDSDHARDAARVGWLETTRLCVTVVAVMLDKLQACLVDPGIRADKRLFRQEEDNVEFLLSLLPKILESYQVLSSPETARVFERVKTMAATPVAVPTAFPASYPFSLLSFPPNTAKSPIWTGVAAAEETVTLFNSTLAETATVFLALVQSSPRKHLLGFLESTLDIEGREHLAKFMSLFFKVAISILHHDAYPTNWLNVNIMAHKVILKMADPVGVMLTREFIPDESHADQFDAALWYDALAMLMSLLASEQLVIEEFSPQKRRAVWRLAGDLRGEGANILLRLWQAIGWDEAVSAQAGVITRYGGYQITLAPLVDPVLDLCLSHHDQLRNNAVQILYSMIVSEFHVNGHFDDIEHRLVNKLDKLYMSDTKGDDISRSFFVGQLRGLFDSSSLDPVLRNRVEEFLDSVNLFLDLLMNVRELPDGDEYQDDRVIATLRLMNYTRKIGRDEMYIKYVHQLVNMHLNSENYVEAALTLKLHADLHEWDLHAFVEALPELDLPRQSQFARKEVLYLLIIEYLSKGKAWETAVEICRELAAQHAEVSFDYRRLAEIMVHQAALLEHIVTDQRYYSEYFRVAFYGNFPAALRDKQFIYRGYEWEKFGAFCERMLNKHPEATLLRTTTEPSDEIRFGTAQYIQCTAVTPEPDRTLPVFTNPDVPIAIRTYYEHSYTRRFIPEGHTRSNDARDVWTEKTVLTTEEMFPTVLRRSCVMDVSVTQYSPVENALQDVRQKTSELAALAHRYSGLAKSGAVVSTNALSMALNAVVDAGAGGSVTLFREVFMNGDYLASHPDSTESIQQLKQAIDNQVRLIDQCLALHEELCPAEMLPFHETLVRFFRKNFHDEIQRLASSEPSQTHLPLAGSQATSTFPRAPTITTANHHDGASSTYLKRSDSIPGRPSFSNYAPKRGHVGVPSVSLSIPISLSTSLRERIASPTEQPYMASPPAPTYAAAAMSPTNFNLTPLQRNIAHLNKYGLSSPGAHGQNGQVHQPPSSPDTTSIGSLVNVGVGAPGRTHSIRDTSSLFSNRTKGRLSRLGSLGWMKRDP